MPTFEQGDVVRVPFPYTDRDTRQHRPALVISRRGPGAGERLCWVLMITSAENRRWPGDVPVVEVHLDCGLPVPSLIRTAKIATIEAGHADRLGAIPPHLLEEVRTSLRGHVGLDEGRG